MPVSKVTIGTTATLIPGQLGRHRRRTITLQVPASGSTVYVADKKGVTTATGIAIQPGTERQYQGTEAEVDFYGIVASGTVDLLVEESPRH